MLSEDALATVIHSLCMHDPKTEPMPNLENYRKNQADVVFISIPSGYSDQGNVCTRGIDGLSVKYSPSKKKAVWWYTGEVPKFRRDQSLIRVGDSSSHVFDTDIAESIVLK